MSESAVFRIPLRPRSDAANIRTWIGFKQLFALIEEGVLGWFRHHEAGPQRLFHEHGLELGVIDLSAQLVTLVEIDDELIAQVGAPVDGRFPVKLQIQRPGQNVTAANAKVFVAVRETSATNRPRPPAIQMLIDSSASSAQKPSREVPRQPPPNAFVSRWRARYFHCHYSKRVQHATYVRALEEAVDGFLESRGLAIPQTLEERGWIPVVSRARVQILGDSHMGEELCTSFVVTECLKDVAWDARMDCYVKRDGVLVPVATANILHGYANMTGPEAGQLVRLDDAVLDRLRSPS